MTRRQHRPRVRRRKTEQGMALALVLGGLVILSMIATALLSGAGREITTGNAVVERARATALVEGAIEASILALFEPGTRRRLSAGDGELLVEIADRPITTRVRDVCGLWDINHGRMEVLTALLNQFGASNPVLITEALTTARGVDVGLLSTDQIRALPGMSVELFRRIRPEITVNCRADRIDPEFASPLLLGAIPNLTANQIASIIQQRREGPIDLSYLAASASYLAPGPGQTYRIIAAFGFGPGSRVLRHAEVTLTYQPDQPFRVLAWSGTE
jgi:hypothetical protein